jgi:DNA-directed RNA polymerase specialized sigma24 family protein/type II secretory pathway pseudopilin PulG
MVQSLKKAMLRRGVKSREALLQRVEGELDGVYDLIHQVFANEALALQVLQSSLKKAVRRSRQERYERYLRLWVLRIAVESIKRAYPRFVAERLPGQKVPFESLSLEEKLVLLLNDRAQLSAEEIASVLQVQVGKVGRYLVYAREKVATEVLGKRWAGFLALRERISLNREMSAPATPYIEAMLAAKNLVAEAPLVKFSTIESSVRQHQLLPILGRSERVRWQDLSWQYKLGLEASMLAVVGLLAVVVLPWTFDQINANALVEGRFAEVFRVESQAQEPVALEEITTDRLLASSEGVEGESVEAPEDEFANVDFPSGDAYEAGTAPLAPSRQAAAVYRLIVQSASPKDLIPEVKALFAKKNIRERESSGREMPGGVYFDGVTNVGNYPLIVQEIEKLGQTKTYSHPGATKNPNDRARVIVWVQQI